MQSSWHDTVAFNNNYRILIFFLLPGLLVFFLRKKGQKHTNPPHPWPKVPGALPFIGNSLEGGILYIADNLEQWARQYGSESGVFDCTLFGKTFVVLCNEEKLTFVDNNRPYKITRRKKFSDVMKSTGADGIFSADGEQWRKDRRMVAPFLNRKSVKDYVSGVKIVAGRLVNKWEETMERDGFVNINPDLMLATIDVISLVAYAKDINGLMKGGQAVRLGKDMKSLAQKSVYRVFSPFSYWNIPIVGQYLDGLGWARSRMLKYMKNIVRDYETSPLSKSESEVKQSFLGKVIMHSKQDNAHINSDRLIGNLVTFFAAGSETTFNTICFALYELCMDTTGLQEELAAEILAMKGLETYVDLESLNDGLPRLRSFVYEVLRYQGTVPFMGLESQEPLELDGCLLPAGTCFFMMMRYVTTLEASIAHAEKSTPRGPRDAPADKFCPRRWLISNEDKGDTKNNEDGEGDGDGDGKDAQGNNLSVTSPTYQTGFRMFGSSLRVCPGRGLAEVEIVVFLAFILSKFKIELQEGHPKMKPVMKIALSPDIDIHLMLKPRIT